MDSRGKLAVEWVGYPARTRRTFMSFTPKDLFKAAPVTLYQKAEDWEEAIHQVTRPWAVHPVWSKRAGEMVRAILKREHAASTSLPVGIALPHARLPDLADIAVAVGQFETPVLFGVIPVRLVIAIATPAARTVDHLTLLSWISRRVAQPARLSALLEAPSAEAWLCAFLSEAE